MTQHRLPRVATWLLTRLSHRNDALLGDLVEEYQHGRGRGWYWRQVLGAICVSFWREVWCHKAMTAQALFTAFGASTLINGFVLGPLSMFVQSVFHPRTVFVSFSLYAVLPSLAAAVAVGRIIDWFYRQHRAAMLLAIIFVAFLLNLPELWRLSYDAATHTRYAWYLVNNIVGMFVPALGLLVGGLWRAHETEGASEPSAGQIS